MSKLQAKKARNFSTLKAECALLTEVALMGLEAGNDNSGLIKNIYEIRTALTNLQIVARKYREDGKGGDLKTYGYRENKSFADNKSMCFYQQFKDLSNKNYLVVIRVASKKMANKCMKIYRNTNAECAKRYYSLFRALEKQIHRLDTTLGKKVAELVNGAEQRTVKYPRPEKKVKEKETKKVVYGMGEKITTVKLGDKVISVKRQKTGEPMGMGSYTEQQQYIKEQRQGERREKELNKE